MLPLWQVEKQVAQKRDQLLEKGMPHQQLDGVLAEYREQQIKAAKETKAENAMTKKQGSVGKDEGAVPIAPLAVAGEAGEVAAGSAVAGEAGGVPADSMVAREAEQDVVRSVDADIEDDGVGPTCPEPNGLVEHLGPPT